jgi:putative aminopeptidase FrvX
MNIQGKEFIFSEFGVSGREELVRNSIEKFASNLVDEILYDITGSLICVKKSKSRASKKVMVAAHMDTIGFVLTYADEKGFLRFSEVGEQPEAYLLGKRVVFENGTVGVIGIERREHEKKQGLEKMFIDVGARSREEALERVRIGDMCAVYSPLAMTQSTLSGGWMDDRIGCFVLMEVMERLGKNPHEILFVFSAQEEVGLRGAQTSSYRLEPDIGIAVDATESSDLPEGELTGSCVLGGGAGIKIMDKSVIVPKRLVQHLLELAEKRNILHQRDIMSAGRTGAQAIQLSRGGVLTGGISVPVRYLHTAGEMCAVSDVKACIDLVSAFCEEKLPI